MAREVKSCRLTSSLEGENMLRDIRRHLLGSMQFGHFTYAESKTQLNTRISLNEFMIHSEETPVKLPCMMEIVCSNELTKVFGSNAGKIGILK